MASSTDIIMNTSFTCNFITRYVYMYVCMVLAEVASVDRIFSKILWEILATVPVIRLKNKTDNVFENYVLLILF